MPSLVVPDPVVDPYILVLEARGYRIIEGRHFTFAKKHGRQMVPHDRAGHFIRKMLHKTQSDCAYCERPLKIKGPITKGETPTIDHKHPLSKGGTWKKNNLCLSCIRCNKNKADMTEAEFRELVQTVSFARLPAACKQFISDRDHKINVAKGGISRHERAAYDTARKAKFFAREDVKGFVTSCAATGATFRFREFAQRCA